MSKLFNNPFPLIALGVALILGFSACNQREADVASFNVSAAADQFEIDRRVVFFNGITDTYLLSIEGRCSINDQGNQLEVICKTGEGLFRKHFLGLSDNVSYFVEQLAPADVSVFHYRVVFRPSVIIPEIDGEIGTDMGSTSPEPGN